MDKNFYTVNVYVMWRDREIKGLSSVRHSQATKIFGGGLKKNV